MKRYYVSPDSRISVKSMNAMSADADKHGWKFAFSKDKTKVIVTWEPDDVETFELEK